MGNTSTEAFTTFLDEFYHKDHGFTDIPCIIFQN